MTGPPGNGGNEDTGSHVHPKDEPTVMNSKPEHTPNYQPGQNSFSHGDVDRPRREIEPLPADFDTDLRRIDRALHQDADRLQTPPGLADRVYEASVVDLPDAHRLRLPGRGAAARRARPGRHAAPGRSVWSRLALAASLGLALIVPAYFMRAPVIGPGDGAGPSRTVLAADLTMTWLEQGQVDRVAPVDREIAYLLGAMPIRASEIRGELEALTLDADFEM